MKKILCLCDAGMHRSVIMAKVLREKGYFAVAGSYDNFYEEILSLHCGDTIEVHEWWNAFVNDWLKKTTFNKIIFMQEGGEDFIGRDELEINDNEWEVRCETLAKMLGLY